MISNLKSQLFLCGILWLAACTNKKATDNPDTQPDQKETSVINKTKTVDFVGSYLSGNKNDGYWVEINIARLNEGEKYQVSVDAMEMKGRKSCTFDKVGVVRNDTLFIETTDWKKPVTTFIVKQGDKIMFDVIEKAENDRYVLNWYCGGGGSLLGEYVKAK